MIQHKIVVTSAYKLKCKHILHIDAMFYSKYNDWEKAYTSALQEAERLGFHSLAVPALGTGTSFLYLFFSNFSFYSYGNQSYYQCSTFIYIYISLFFYFIENPE